MGILRTYQVNGCDNDDLHLQCDSRTVISMVAAQYGQPVPRKYSCRTTSNSSSSSTMESLLNHYKREEDVDDHECSEADHLRVSFCSLFLLCLVNY